MSPSFKSIFDEQWEDLPPVLKSHYANRPFSHDRVTAMGVLDIEMRGWLKLFSPLIRLSGMLTPYSGQNIPVTVHFLSEPKTNAFVFERHFTFPQGPIMFRSKMTSQRPHEVIEYMKLGVGWQAGYHFDGQRIIMSHRGYVLKIFGQHIALPKFIDALVGLGFAWEEAISDDEFIMHMELKSPLLGCLYAYSGRFKITEVALGNA
jgi:hypothetical protein